MQQTDMQGNGKRTALSVAMPETRYGSGGSFMEPPPPSRNCRSFRFCFCTQYTPTVGWPIHQVQQFRVGWQYAASQCRVAVESKLNSAVQSSNGTLFVLNWQSRQHTPLLWSIQAEAV